MTLLNVMAHNFIQIFLPLREGGQYSLIVFQGVAFKMFLFDPNPIRAWSRKYEWKRWSQKLDTIFPLYKKAMKQLYSISTPKEYWFWDTPVMDDGFGPSNR